MAVSSDTLSAAGSLTIGCNSENIATFAIAGAYVGLSALVEATIDGTNWFQLAALRDLDKVWETTTITPTDGVSRSWKSDVTDFVSVRFRVTALTSGSVSIRAASSNQAAPLVGGLPPTTASATITTVTTSSDVVNSSGVGTANGTGVTAVEYGSGVIHKTVISLANTAIALTDDAGVIAYAGQKIYDFPEGALLFLGASADLVLGVSAAGVNADWDGDFSLGTVTASNNNTLSSTEADLIPSTATPQADTSATTAQGQTTTALSGVIFDGTATAKDCYLNFLVDDADHDVTNTATNLLVTGTVTLTWANLGDYTAP